MWRWRQVVAKLRNFFLHSSAEGELSRELYAQIALKEERWTQRGIDAGDARLTDRCLTDASMWMRRGTCFVRMLAALSELKYALLVVVVAPGSNIIALLPLALGLGANAEILRVPPVVLLRPRTHLDPLR